MSTSELFFQSPLSLWKEIGISETQSQVQWSTFLSVSFHWLSRLASVNVTCCTIRAVEEYSWQQAFMGIWKSFETINKLNNSCLWHWKSSESSLPASQVDYPESLDCVFKLNCIMISLYDWRERGEVWPSKNRRAPDGEKDRAGAAAGLASVTASGVLSKILFSWVSPLWKSLEEELTGWCHSRKETVCAEAFHDMHDGTAAFMRFRQGLTGSEGWTLYLNSKGSSDGFPGVLYLLSGGTSWVTGVGQDLCTKKFSCPTCLSFLPSSITLQTCGGRGGIYCFFQVPIHWVQVNQMRTVWDAL